MKKLALSIVYGLIIFGAYSFYLNDFKFLVIREVVTMPLIICSILFIINYVLHKIKGYKLNEKPELAISENLDLEEVKEVALANKWEILSEDVDSIEFKTPLSLLSFGEKVSVSNKTNKIKSNSYFSFIIYDFGKNLENLKQIKTVL